MLKKHTFTISAATHFGVDDRLNHVVEMIKKTDANEVYHIENIQYKKAKKRQDSIINISKQAKPFLVEKEYITAADAEYINVREVYNEDIARLVRQIPRGNDEAEARFRKQLGSGGILDEFENRGIQKGDVLKILSPYEGLEERYIQY